VNNNKITIESILDINNDLIKLKSKSPYNKTEIKNIKDRMKEKVSQLLDSKDNSN